MSSDKSSKLPPLSILVSLYIFVGINTPFPPTNLYNKTLNDNLPAPALKDKTWKFLNGRKPPPALLCSPCSCLRGPRSISIKTSSFMISANGDSGGIQLANTQTFSHLKKTAAAIVNKTITDCRRLPSPPNEKM